VGKQCIRSRLEHVRQRLGCRPLVGQMEEWSTIRSLRGRVKGSARAGKLGLGGRRRRFALLSTPILHDGTTTYRLATRLLQTQGWTVDNTRLPSRRWISREADNCRKGVHNGETLRMPMVPVTPCAYPNYTTHTPRATPTPRPRRTPRHPSERRRRTKLLDAARRKSCDH